MSDWKIIPFGQLFDTIYRYPTYYGIEYHDKGIPELRGELIGTRGKILENYRYIDEKTAQLYPKIRLRENDLIMSVRGTLGKFGYALKRHKGAVITANLLRLSPNHSLVIPKWLLFVVLDKKFLSKLELLSSQTTIKTIQVPQLCNIAINLPPLPQQRRIAEILSTVDEAIEHTEALIDKTRKVKAGLMHDLFTLGVTPDGKLRPPREEAPELYKESELGWIPKEWECMVLEKAIPKAVYGISNALNDGPGIPVLRMNNIKEGEVSLSDLKYCNSNDAYKLQLRKEDVLFNRTNSIEHVGRTGIWMGDLSEISFASYLVRLDVDPLIIRQKFLNFWLNWELTQIRIRKFATPGVHQVNINPTNLRSVLISLPKTISEQDLIIDRIQSSISKVFQLRNEKEKFQLIKNGLMHDLLTGKVEVSAMD